MKYLLLVFIFFFVIPFAGKSQAVRQLKVAQHQVSVHTQFLPGGSPALQQVIHITLNRKPLAVAFIALLQITMQPAASAELTD